MVIIGNLLQIIFPLSRNDFAYKERDYEEQILGQQIEDFRWNSSRTSIQTELDLDFGA